MFNYKKFSLPMIFKTFFSYSTNKIESPCTNSRYSQCLKSFSYLLTVVAYYCKSRFTVRVLRFAAPVSLFATRVPLP